MDRRVFLGETGERRFMPLTDLNQYFFGGDGHGEEVDQRAVVEAGEQDLRFFSRSFTERGAEDGAESSRRMGTR